MTKQDMSIDTVIVDQPTVYLDMTSRCDRCGAQAWIAFGVAESEITLCRHHGNKHLDAIIEQGGEVLEDKREEIQ